MTWHDAWREGWWWLGPILVWTASMIVLAIVRSIRGLIELGPRAWLCNAFRMEPETWRLIGILIFVAIAAMLAFVGQSGLPC